MHLPKTFFAITAIFLAGAVTTPASSQSLEPAQPVVRRMIDPPPAFTDSCKRYQWFCENRTTSVVPVERDDVLELAMMVNRRVNSMITELSDPENYGAADYWSLPSNGNGDCEDFVLQKYKLLLDAGVDSSYLSIAIVLNWTGENHAVLILRHHSGDLVLDNLSRQIRPWNQTDYQYLAMQSREDRMAWEVVVNQSRDRTVLAER